MMDKIKTTGAEIKRKGTNMISVGYCGMQTLLHNHRPFAYTSGIYGWNYDVYDVYGTTICTGYRAMPGRRANNVQSYEDKAREIMDDYKRDYDDRCAEIEKLLREFLEQA